MPSRGIELRGGRFWQKGLRTGAARVNERAVNVKQNQSYHPDRLPEFHMFREIFQAELGIITALVGSVPEPARQQPRPTNLYNRS